MQLPRGTFHSIKKGILFRSLLDEMEKNRFSGYCTISCGIETCTLVLSSGIYILADYHKLEGDPAWQKIQKLLDTKVDAGLTTLNNVQLQLAREFNPHATLPSFVRKSPTRQVRTGTTNSVARRREELPGNGTTNTRLEHQETLAPYPAPQIETTKMQQVRQISTRVNPKSTDNGQSTEKKPVENGSDIDRDLEALDTMNIDEMTKKIRESCRVTVENLDLDHLIQKSED